MADEVQLNTSIYNSIISQNPSIPKEEAQKEADNIVSLMLSGELSEQEVKNMGYDILLLEDEEYLNAINIIQDIQENNSYPNDFSSNLDENTQTALISVLENIVNEQEKSLHAIKDNNGVIAKGWDWFKNKTGIGAGSDKAQDEINKLKEEIENLKNGKTSLAQCYKNVTGNDLTQKEFDSLINGDVDFSNSKVINSVSKYQQGQKQVTNTLSTIASGVAIVGLTTAGIVATPFTGGMSLGASIAAIGTLTAAGTAAYMVPQAIDGFSEKDGYSLKEATQDLATGTINSAFTATGIGAGKALSTGLTAGATTQAGKVAAQFAANEAASLIIGDGIAVGDYLVETGFNDDVDFSLRDLGTVTLSATSGSLAAGAVNFAAGSYIRPVLTSGTTAQSQVVGRLLSSGISGSAAGASATIAAGSTNYLLNCQLDGKEVEFEDWLNAATENVASGAITGCIASSSFEIVQIASGVQLPENSVKTKNCTTEDGLKYKEYLDKNGKVVAIDTNPKDLLNIMQAKGMVQQEGLVEYNSENTAQNSNARTVRITFDTKSQNITRNGIDYQADALLTRGYQYDWADKPMYLGARGYLNLTELTNNAPETNYAQFNSKNNYPIAINQQNQYIIPINNANNMAATIPAPMTSENVAPLYSSAAIANLNLAGNQINQPSNITNTSSSLNSNITTNIQQYTDTEKTTVDILKEKLNGEKYEYALETYNYDYETIAKCIDCVKTRAKTYNIEIKEETIIDVLEKYDYDAETMMVSTTCMSNKTGILKAYVLSKLIDNNIIDMETLYKATNPIIESRTFSQAARSEDYGKEFADILKDCNIEESKIEYIQEIISKVQFEEVPAEKIGIIIDNLSNINSSLDFEYLILDSENQPIVKEFIDKFDQNNVKLDIRVTPLQYNLGKETVTQASFTTEEGTEVKVIQTILPDKTVKIERTETYQDGSENSWYVDSQESYIGNNTVNEKYTVLNNQIQIKYDETTKEPVSVVYKKASDKLDGVYETIEYKLSDYPEDYDVLTGIKEGSIQGGKTISTVQVNDDGSKTYIENITANNSTIERKYEIANNEIDSNYSFKITDENGNTTLDISRSFEQLEKNKTKTVINGKEYIAQFDDKNQTITIKTQNETTTINIQDKTQGNVQLWQACKNMPADTLLDINSAVNKWNYCDNENSEMNFHYKSLDSSENIGIIEHELGHYKDLNLNIAEDKNLISIYDEEIKAFNSKQTSSSGQQYIDYFSQTGGFFNTGLNEVIAETNMLLSTCGHNIDFVSARAQLLVQNFPKTISYIAQKMNISTETISAPEQETIAALNKNAQRIVSPKIKYNKIEKADSKKIEYRIEDKKYLDRNTIEKLSEISYELAVQYNNHINEPAQEISERFKNISSIEEISARSKSENSIYEKNVKGYENGKIDINDISSSYKFVRDAFGTRIQMKSLDQDDVTDTLLELGIECSYKEICDYISKKYENLDKNLVNTLDKRKTEILDNLKVKQNSEVFKKLLEEIQKGDNPLIITEISNYGDELSAYFTSEQIKIIARAYYEKTGIKLNIISKDNVVLEGIRRTDKNGKCYIDTDTASIRTDAATKKSGYPSAQINIEHTLSDGSIGYGELQIRGISVNKIAEVEHVIYDIKQDKIKEWDTKYSDIYYTVQDLSNESYERYNQYLTDEYNYARLLELGFKIDSPQIGNEYYDDYGNIVDVSNLKIEALMKYAQ